MSGPDASDSPPAAARARDPRGAPRGPRARRRRAPLDAPLDARPPRSILTDRLSKINEALARRVMARNEYDKTIQETEAAYMKILESSQTLLHVLKRETVNLTKKKQYSS